MSFMHPFSTYIRRDSQTGWTSSLGRNLNKIGRLMNNHETNGNSGHLVFVTVTGTLFMLASLGLMGYRISEGYKDYPSSIRERYEALSWGYIAAIVVGGGGIGFALLEEEMRGEKILHAGSMILGIAIILVGIVCSIILVTNDFNVTENNNYILSFLSLISFMVGVGIFMSVIHRLGMRVLMNNLPVTDQEIIDGMKRKENQNAYSVKKKKRCSKFYQRKIDEKEKLFYQKVLI